MPKLPLYDMSGKNVGSVAAADKIFGKEPNPHAVQVALVWYLASKRRGTQSAKTRAEVSGGGKKPWKQKGTGRARAGSTRSPLWRKGGVIFAPKPRDYNYSLPKKARKLALKVALSDKTREDKIKVVEEFKLPSIKTKLAAKFLKDLAVAGKTLILTGKDNNDFVRSVRNIRGLTVHLSRDLNIFDLLHADWVIAEKSAVTQLEEGLA